MGSFRRIAENLSQRLDVWMSAWEGSRILGAYTRLRRRFSGPPLPGMPDSTDLDPYVFVSVGLHLLVVLLIFLLVPRIVPLSQRPPIHVRILETKAQAPAPARKQKPVRQKKTRKAQTKPRQKPKPKPKAKPKPTPPKPVEKPVFTPKAIPRVARTAPKVPRGVPKALPKEAVTPKSQAPAPETLLAEKGLLPPPLKPFEAESPPEGAPSEVPRSLAAPPPTVPEGGPSKITPLPTPSETASPTTLPSVPEELSREALEGFEQPTGPVVVPERFLKAGRPQTQAGSAVELIDTSDPDFTEYFELIKRRVYASWRYPKGVRGVHKVSLRFSLDRAGAAHGIKVVRSSNRDLDASAADAMDRASPFPPIPEKFRALVGQPLTLIFTVTIQ